MVPVGQPYHPAGTLDARSILITTILGTTAAVIGAALVWLWELSPIPTLLLLTPLLQEPDLFALPGAAAASLVEAVRENDHSRIATLRTSPVVDNGSGSVGATLHACPGCDQSFADVSHRFVKGKETKVTVLLKQHRVSPEVVEVIRSELTPPKMAKADLPGDDGPAMSET